MWLYFSWLGSTDFMLFSIKFMNNFINLDHFMTPWVAGTLASWHHWAAGKCGQAHSCWCITYLQIIQLAVSPHILRLVVPKFTPIKVFLLSQLVPILQFGFSWFQAVKIIFFYVNSGILCLWKIIKKSLPPIFLIMCDIKIKSSNIYRVRSKIPIPPLSFWKIYELQ